MTQKFPTRISRSVESENCSTPHSPPPPLNTFYIFFYWAGNKTTWSSTLLFFSSSNFSHGGKGRPRRLRCTSENIGSRDFIYSAFLVKVRGISVQNTGTYQISQSGSKCLRTCDFFPFSFLFLSLVADKRLLTATKSRLRHWNFFLVVPILNLRF